VEDEEEEQKSIILPPIKPVQREVPKESIDPKQI
jgi:hypothetical protein